MAEGGGEDEKENPFLFKNFVSNKDTTNTSTGDTDPDIFDIPEQPGQRKREKHRQIVVVVDDVKPKQQKKGKAKRENPFSFKKFLSNSGGSGSTKPQRGHLHQPVDDVPVRPDVGQISGDLPDFVQDHYNVGVHVVATGLSSPRGLDLPDFTLVGLSGNTNLASDNDRESDSDTVTLGHIDKADLLLCNDLHTDDSTRGVDVASRQSGILPDFLSDAAIGESHGQERDEDVDTLTDDTRQHVIGDLDLQLHRLRDENLDLKRQLAEARSRTLSETERIAELQQQMVEQRRKEADETGVMENAIQQVEQTLSSTTTRAVHAESTVSRLKQEMKSLQAEVKALRNENASLRSGDNGLLEVKERTSYVAEQLCSATETADKSLRQLLSGIDNLKLLSQVLKSIDKISEETNAPSTEEENNKKTYDDT